MIEEAKEVKITAYGVSGYLDIETERLSVEPTPDQRLVIEIAKRMIGDYISLVTVGHFTSDSIEWSTGRARKIRQEVEECIFTDEDMPYTLRWWLELAFEDSEGSIQTIRKKLKKDY